RRSNVADWRQSLFWAGDQPSRTKSGLAGLAAESRAIARIRHLAGDFKGDEPAEAGRGLDDSFADVRNAEQPDDGAHGTATARAVGDHHRTPKRLHPAPGADDQRQNRR